LVSISEVRNPAITLGELVRSVLAVLDTKG